MMTPSCCSASASAKADLPLAVGPAMRMVFGNSLDTSSTAPFPTARIARHVLRGNADLVPGPPGGDRCPGAESRTLSAARPSGRLAGAGSGDGHRVPAGRTGRPSAIRGGRRSAERPWPGYSGHHRRHAGRCRYPAARRTPQEASRRRYGFYHDRPGMHRRARRLCRFQGSRRGDHRARHARRDRVRTGAARTCRAAPRDFPPRLSIR